MRKALVAANWKMHGTANELQDYLAALELHDSVDVVLLPPAVYLSAAIARAPAGLACGVQDIGTAAAGAHTGEIAAEMVRDIGGSWSIVGHSERRLDQREADDLVATKAAAALRGGLAPIICVGETLDERQAGHEQAVVARQLDAVLDRIERAALRGAAIRYEPVWAIGTGETASPAQAQEIHAFLRDALDAVIAEGVGKKIRILYGGSVKPENAEGLLSQPDIDGALVGGACLEAGSFWKIVQAAEKVSK